MNKPIALCVSALALAVALPAAAQAADEQSCYGKITPIEKTTERDAGVDYEFVCAQAIKSFAVTTNVQTTSFDVSADVFDPKELGGDLRGDDRFGECEGDLPGFGFTCAGAYGGFGRVVKATFDTMDDPCARDAGRHVITRALVVTESTSGKLSGPFDLNKINGCPKPAKAKTQSRKKSHKHKAKR
jgi:hypothetical protein